MENKLQELTNKLYEEGLSKGRSDAGKLMADAEQKAKSVVADAEERAEAILNDAKKAAEETKKNAVTELSLASRQTVAALKESIADMIVTKAVSGSVGKVAMDPSFIKEMLLAVASNWSGSSDGKVELNVLLPADMKDKFEKEFEGSVKNVLNEGVEVGYSDKVKNGFKVGPKDGGYYISFTDTDFNALLGAFLKEKVAAMLYNE